MLPENLAIAIGANLPQELEEQLESSNDGSRLNVKLDGKRELFIAYSMTIGFGRVQLSIGSEKYGGELTIFEVADSVGNKKDREGMPHWLEFHALTKDGLIKTRYGINGLRQALPLIGKNRDQIKLDKVIEDGVMPNFEELPEIIDFSATEAKFLEILGQSDWEERLEQLSYLDVLVIPNIQE